MHRYRINGENDVYVMNPVIIQADYFCVDGIVIFTVSYSQHRLYFFINIKFVKPLFSSQRSFPFDFFSFITFFIIILLYREMRFTPGALVMVDGTRGLNGEESAQVRSQR